MGVRDPLCDPKCSILVKETRGVSRKVLLPKKTHDHGYHIDFELCDRSRN